MENLIKMGWFGGLKTPIFGNIHILQNVINFFFNCQVRLLSLPCRPLFRSFLCPWNDLSTDLCRHPSILSTNGKTEILDGAFCWFVFVKGFFGNVSNQRWPTALLKNFLLQTSKNTRSPFKKMPKISQGFCDSETDTTLSSLHRCCFSLLRGKLTSQVLQRHFSTSSDQLKIHKNSENMFFRLWLLNSLSLRPLNWTCKQKKFEFKKIMVQGFDSTWIFPSFPVWFTPESGWTSKLSVLSNHQQNTAPTPVFSKKSVGVLFVIISWTNPILWGHFYLALKNGDRLSRIIPQPNGGGDMGVYRLPTEICRESSLVTGILGGVTGTPKQKIRKYAR